MELFLEGYGQEVCRIWKAELYCIVTSTTASGKTPRRFYGVPWPEQYAILFDLTRAAPPRTRTPNLSVEDMLRTYELAASGSLMPVGDNTWAKTNKFASVPPSRVIEAQFVNVT